MGKYLKLFQTHSEYEQDAPNRLYPNVSHCIAQNEVHYNPTDPTLRFYYQNEIAGRLPVDFYEDNDGNWRYGPDAEEGSTFRIKTNPRQFDKIILPLTHGGEITSVTVNHPEIRQLTYHSTGKELVIEDVEGSWGIDGGTEWTNSYRDIEFDIYHTTEGHECQTHIYVNPGIH